MEKQEVIDNQEKADECAHSCYTQVDGLEPDFCKFGDVKRDCLACNKFVHLSEMTQDCDQSNQ